MNDLERRVKTVLDADAAKAPRVSHPPDRLRRRVRRRQVGRSALVTLTVSATALVSFAGFRAIEGSFDDDRIAVDDPWAGYEVFERTATIENFTITSPSDWYLVRPAGRPVLQLTNFDPGLNDSVCGSHIPPDGVALFIAQQVGPDLRVAPSTDFPPAFDTTAEERDGACGMGRYITFGEGGTTAFVAWAGFGDEVDPADRQLVVDSFAAMAFDRRVSTRLWHPSAYVIAGGENTAGPWRLELRPQTNPGNITNVQLELIAADGTRSQAGRPFTVPFLSIESSGDDPVFGAVSREATGVEFRPSDGATHVAGSIVPLPPTLRFDFDLFFIAGIDDTPGEVEPVGLSSDEMISRDVVPIRDVFNGVPYKVERRGSLDGRACVVVTIDDATDGFCREPGSLLIEELATVRPFTYGAVTVLVGVLPQGASAHFKADGGRQAPQHGECAMDVTVWDGAQLCALSVASTPSSGVVEITDVSGTVSEQPVRWLAAPPDPRRVATGVTGGTAWALDYEEGRQLALVGDGRDIVFDRIASNQMASLSRDNLTLIGTHDFGTAGEPRYLLYGVTHHDVDELSIVFADGRVITFERGELHNPSIHIFGRFPNTSPGVWWEEMPPGPVVAEIVAFDTACEVIARSGLALQPPSAVASITAQAGCDASG